MADDILKNIPLPADLPENWTSDQIVAPTGAEVGLDEQHGYNYLMRQVNNAQKAAKAIAAALLNYTYPVGSLYMSAEATSPASLFGGTWEQIKDRFILAAGDTYAAGSTGGEATHTLTVSEMPTHNHSILSGDGSNSQYGAKIETTSNGTFENFAIQNAGGSQPHNNMPPYFATYVWKRIV